VESYSFEKEPTDKLERARFWHHQIMRARRFEENWRNRCHDIIERYRDDHPERMQRDGRSNISLMSTTLMRLSAELSRTCS
jgi:hypothetical protein